MDVAEKIAKAFHASYENMAPHFAYTTRAESAVPWEQVPEENRNLMIATVHALIAQGIIKPGELIQGPVVKPTPNYGPIKGVRMTDGD